MKKIIPLSLLLCAVLLGFFVPDIIHSFSSHSFSQKPLLDLDEYCMLSTEPCEQNQARMMLHSDQTQPLVANTIEVVWDEATSDTLLLSLRGLEMEMGTAKYQLVRQPNGKFIGEIMLPVCTQDEMTWVGILSDGVHEVYPAIRMER